MSLNAVQPGSVCKDTQPERTSMFSTNLKRPLVALAVTAGLLTVAGPAGAGTLGGNSGNSADAIVYNGHAGLGANANASFSGDAYDDEMGIWLGSNDALAAAIVAADFDYKEAKVFIESQYEPISVEAIDVWETLHGDFSTFPTNLTHRPDGPPAGPPLTG
jgi:hypothetical protein